MEEYPIEYPIGVCRLTDFTSAERAKQMVNCTSAYRVRRCPVIVCAAGCVDWGETSIAAYCYNCTDLQAGMCDAHTVYVTHYNSGALQRMAFFSFLGLEDARSVFWWELFFRPISARVEHTVVGWQVSWSEHFWFFRAIASYGCLKESHPFVGENKCQAPSLSVTSGV